MNNYKEQFLGISNELVWINPLKDKNAKQYNKVFKNLFDIWKKILEMQQYEEIFLDIIKQTNDKKYIDLHNNIAWFIYSKNKILSKKIYEMHKDSAMWKHALAAFFND